MNNLNGLYGLAGYVSCSFQLGSDFGDFQRITVELDVTYVRTSGTFHSHQCSRRPLSAGHTVDCIVDQDNRDILATVQCVDRFGCTDTSQVTVTLVCDCLLYTSILR